MVGRQSAETCGQFRGAEIGELLGMQLDRQPRASSRLEDAPGLFARKADPLAEGIHRIGKAEPGGFGDDRFADQVDIDIGPAFELRRQGMGGEQCRAYRDSARLAEGACGAELFQLVLKVEPVAGLDLDGGDAFSDQRIETWQGLGDQFLFARRARGRNGGADPAAGTGDLLIARPFQTQLELTGTVAGMNQMRVTVDQARRDPAALAIGDVAFAGKRRVTGRPGIEDATILRDKRAIFHDAKSRQTRSHRGQSCVLPDPPGAQAVTPAPIARPWNNVYT